MQLDELADARAQSPAAARISGFGAHRAARARRVCTCWRLPTTTGAPGRATARVRVVVAPLEEHRGRQAAARAQRRVERAGVSDAVVRRYRGDAAPLVRDMRGGWRSGRFDAVLAGDFDLIARNR